MTNKKEQDLKDKARKLHFDSIVVDTHADTISRMIDPPNNTLIETTGGQMCDDPECTMIGHCAIENEDRNTDGAPCEFLFNGISEYYKQVPIYTKNKNHELCALCILE